MNPIYQPAPPEATFCHILHLSLYSLFLAVFKTNPLTGHFIPKRFCLCL